MDAADTFPKLLLRSREKYGTRRVAMRKKKYGIWNEYTWEDCYQNIKALSLGLIRLGLQRGEKVCICGDNDPEWYWAELGTQSAGGISIGIFTDATPPEILYIVNHSEAVLAFAKDQEQCDKILQIREELPNVRKVVYWDPKGMSAYKDPYLISLAQVQELGRKVEQAQPGLFEENINRGKGSDLGVFCYTSATTGAHPKGVMLTYDYFRSSLDRGAVIDGMTERDEYLSFAPGAWITEQGLGIGWWLREGMKVNFPEEPETVQENIREIGANFLLFGSRQWESLHSTVQMKINDAWVVKRALYNLCMRVGYRTAKYRLNERRHPPLLWALLNTLCDWIIFRPIRNYLGLLKLRLGITAGTLLGPDIFTWFHAIGVPIKDMYGLTEALYLTSVPTQRVKIGTSGRPLPGVELRVSEEGELVLKAENMCQGYYNNPEATRKAFDKEGWFHTGDAAVIDPEGYLIILDRLGDMMILKDRTRYSPTYLENSLKFSPYIKDAIAIGSGRDFVSAIITIDFENVGKWAEKKRVPYTTFVSLSQRPEVYGMIQKDIQRVNQALPPNLQIKKFALLHKEFDPDEGEMTRTRKLRRWFLEDKYKDLSTAIYAGEKEIVSEAAVKYRDGRKGTITTAIHIQDVA
jgi:long-chain acyl-CoA synthetase